MGQKLGQGLLSIPEAQRIASCTAEFHPHPAPPPAHVFTGATPLSLHCREALSPLRADARRRDLPSGQSLGVEAGARVPGIPLLTGTPACFQADRLGSTVHSTSELSLPYTCTLLTTAPEPSVLRTKAPTLRLCDLPPGHSSP